MGTICFRSRFVPKNVCSLVYKAVGRQSDGHRIEKDGSLKRSILSSRRKTVDYDEDTIQYIFIVYQKKYVERLIVSDIMMARGILRLQLALSEVVDKN